MNNQLDEVVLRERTLRPDLVGLGEAAGLGGRQRLGGGARHHDRALGGHEREAERIRDVLADVEIGAEFHLTGRVVLVHGDQLHDERRDLTVFVRLGALLLLRLRLRLDRGRVGGGLGATRSDDGNREAEAGEHYGGLLEHLVRPFSTQLHFGLLSHG